MTNCRFEEGYDKGYRDGASQAKLNISEYEKRLNTIIELTPLDIREAIVAAIRIDLPGYLITYNSNRKHPLRIESLT